MSSPPANNAATNRDGWCVIVPVKRRELAKTRLTGRAGGLRKQLALAFAEDTVAAALGADGVRRVLVVTDDQTAARHLSALGAVVVADEPDDGLNPALRHGADVARRLSPDCGVAAVQADLPALTSDVLTRALTRASRQESSFVADAAGIGTTMYAARPGAAFDPRFGGASRAGHAAAGAVELAGADLERLRRDVDTEADLRIAVRLGVGAHTRESMRPLADLR